MPEVINACIENAVWYTYTGCQMLTMLASILVAIGGTIITVLLALILKIKRK